MSEQERSNLEGPTDLEAAISLEARTIEAPIGLEAPTIEAPIGLEAPTIEAPIGLEAPTIEAPISLEGPIVETLRTCYDPEIPVDIYELGLIYGIDVQPSGEVTVKMTLTSPNCPVAGSLPLEVEQKVQAVPGVTGVKVELVWDPPWCMDKMSEAAKLQLGMF